MENVIEEKIDKYQENRIVQRFNTFIVASSCANRI